VPIVILLPVVIRTEGEGHMPIMTITSVTSKNPDLGVAAVAAAALCGAGITQEFPGDLVCRPSVAGLDILYATPNGATAHAGLVRAGFSTVEAFPLPDLPPISNPTTITIVPLSAALIPFADGAADSLCGAGLLVQNGDGTTYTVAPDKQTIKVTCDHAKTATVQAAFTRVWQFLVNPGGLPTPNVG
jgi:hypothetical protein